MKRIQMIQVLAVATALLFVSTPAFAEVVVSDPKGNYAIGAGIAIGAAALGGTLGQGNAAKAALEGIARNPGAAGALFTPMIIGLALIESLVILAFVIAFFVQGNI